MAALIGVCDLVLTPIEDHTGHESWSLPIAITNGIEDYKAAAWQEYWRRAWSACAPCVHGAAPTIPNPHADLRRSQSPCPHPHMPMCWRPILTCPCVGARSIPLGELFHLPTISRPSPDGAPAGAEWRPSSLPPCRSSMSPRVSSASAAAFVRASRLRDGRMPYLGPRSLFMTDRLCSSRRSSAQRS